MSQWTPNMSERYRSRSPSRWSEKSSASNSWDAQWWEGAAQSSAWNAGKGQQQQFHPPPRMSPPSLPFATPRKSYATSLESWIQPSYNHTVVPQEFVQDANHYDTRLDRGMPLMKHVQHTENTVARDIAGMPVEKIPLINVIYEGYGNWCLRHLAMGRPTYFIMAKTFDKSCLLYSINSGLRDENMDKIAQDWNNKQALILPINTNEDKRQVVTKFGEAVASHIIEGSMNQDKNLFARVQELEQELIKSRQALAETQGGGTGIGPLAKYSRSKPAKVLQNDAPANSNAKEVGAWIEKNLTAAKKKKLAKAIEGLKEHAQAQIPQEPARLEILLLALIDHGMPVKMAAKFDKDQAYRMIAALHIKESD